MPVASRALWAPLRRGWSPGTRAAVHPSKTPSLQSTPAPGRNPGGKQDGGESWRWSLLPSSTVRRMGLLQRAMKCKIPSHKSLITVIIPCCRVQKTSRSFCSTPHLLAPRRSGLPHPIIARPGFPSPIDGWRKQTSVCLALIKMTERQGERGAKAKKTGQK